MFPPALDSKIGKPLQQQLMWLDGKETSFNTSTIPGDHCNFAGGGDDPAPLPVVGSVGPIPVDPFDTEWLPHAPSSNAATVSVTA